MVTSSPPSSSEREPSRHARTTQDATSQPQTATDHSAHRNAVNDFTTEDRQTELWEDVSFDLPPESQNLPDSQNEEEERRDGSLKSQNDPLTQRSEQQEATATIGDDDDDDDDDQQAVQVPILQKPIRKARPKLSFAFFKPKAREIDVLNAENESGATGVPITTQGEEEEPAELLWSLFLDIVAKFPPLERQSSSTSEHPRRRQEERNELDRLLAEIRRWSQMNHPDGLSLLEFAQKVEKLSVHQDFYDHRQELLKRYITTDWKEAATRQAEKTETKGHSATPCMDSSAQKHDQEQWNKSFTVGRGTAAGTVSRESLHVDEYDPFDNGMVDDSWEMTLGSRADENDGHGLQPGKGQQQQSSAVRREETHAASLSAPWTGASKQADRLEQPEPPVLGRRLSKEELERLASRKKELMAKRAANQRIP